MANLPVLLGDTAGGKQKRRATGSLEWTDRIIAIEAALRRLPISLPAAPSAVSVSTMIPWIARRLARGRGVELRNPMISAAATRKELASVQKATADLLAALDSLHQPACTALDEMFAEMVATELVRWLMVRLTGLEAAAAHAEVPQSSPNAGRGRPAKRGAAAVAQAAATYYTLLTDEQPTIHVSANGTASGPFMALLDAVFAALGMSASPESQARATIAAMKKNRSK